MNVVDRIMKRIAKFSVIIIFMLLCSYKALGQEGSIYVDNIRMYPPYISSLDSNVLFCATYTYSYESMKYKKKKTCHCAATRRDFLEWEIDRHLCTSSYKRENYIIIWDKSFVMNYILPLFTKAEYREPIEYTITHSNDSTFTAEKVIDYESKVIINDKMYYYPLKIKKGIMVFTTTKWIQSVIPQSSWIYNSPCYNVKESEQVILLIPILESKE